MPRRAVRPRYWPSKSGFYITVNKRTWLLARGDKGDPEVIATATARAGELLAQVGRRNLPKRRPVLEDEREFLEMAARPHVWHALDFLWCTGCRPAEAVAVTAADLDYEAEAVRFRKPERLVPLGEKWLVYRSLAMSQQGPILRNSGGRPWTLDALHGAFSRLRDSLGLDKSLTLLSFRHAYAVTALGRMDSPECEDTLEKLAWRLGISVAHLRDLYGGHVPKRFWK
jgi:integrase